MATEGYFIPGDPGSEAAQVTRARQAKDARKGLLRTLVESMLPVPSRAPASEPSQPTRRPAAAVAR